MTREAGEGLRKPLVVRVVRGSTVDGPGLRSVVFFKGCSLRCRFCHNPEAQEFGPELTVHPDRCVGCAACVAACPTGAVVAPASLDRSLCTVCGACAEACPSGALSMVGQAFSLEELEELLARDRAWYELSGGGVTFSGGEPGLFPEFAGELARRIRRRGWSVWLQTSGHFPWEPFAEHLLPYLDGIAFDVKAGSDELYRELTGADSGPARRNLARLAAWPGTLEVRMPLVPGWTDTDENLEAVARLLSGLGIRHLTLLAYNPLGASMAEALGRTWDAPDRGYRPREIETIYARFRALLARLDPEAARGTASQEQGRR